MSIEIVTVSSKRQLRRFIKFNYELYKESPFAVPDFRYDMFNIFTPQKNPAYEFCDVQLFLAKRGGKIVGRVAAIINNKANKIWNTNKVRFGWIDFIDDKEVSTALINAVSTWGVERGMSEIEGPFGFTDFDPEGMLIEGFDQSGTMSTNYNYSYYSEHLEHLGFVESAKWVEWLIPFRDIPEKMSRISELVISRYNLSLANFEQGKKKEAKKYAKKLFELVNESYSGLYGYSPFSDKQIDDFVRRYLMLINKKLVIIILNQEKEPVAAGLVIPSMSEALRKAKGRLFPFGWFHLIKAIWFNRTKVVDLMFIAIKPSYQNKGLNAVMFNQLIPVAREMGFQYAESNPELESNFKMQAHWDYFPGSRVHKRRVAYLKAL
ncbi:MAG TPA: N-acetyltransferase [Bacteroidaceae bacterium]|nr:N-acetyltransferase [Bacteroidaceae bacterium]